MSKIIDLGDRLKPVISEEAAEHQAEAEAFAEVRSPADEFDLSNARQRARAINGALSTFDFVPLTGPEYWSVYGSATDVPIFMPWLIKARATIDDILNNAPCAIPAPTNES